MEREKEDAFRAKRAPDAFSPPGPRPGSPSSPSSRAAPLSDDDGSSPTGAPSSLDADDAPNASLDPDDAPWSLPAFPASPAALRRFPSDLAHRWDTLPSRYRLMFGTTCAFVLCNMDKVNISVAIIPMAKDMGWSVGQAGVLQSAFFYGFALSQLPGGYLATRFGGAKMLPIGVFVWSAATCAVPFLAGDDRGVFLSRVLVGLGEGISPAAATDVIARSVVVEERGRAVAFVFNGFNVGSVLGLSLAPLIIETFGWRSVFVAFGGLGLVWCAWVGGGGYRRGGATPARFDEYEASRETYVSKGGNTFERRDGEEGKEGRAVLLEEGEPRLTPFDDATGKPVLKGVPGPLAPVEGLAGLRREDDDASASSAPPVPWREMLASTPLRALAFVHFCNNWGFYVLLAWLPSYFTQELGATLTNASLFTLLPPLANIAVASVVGPLADGLLARGVAVETVRKGAQAVALCGPASFMALTAVLGAEYDLDPIATVGLLTVGLSLSSFSYAGLYCNHQDMSPRFASILLGMTNTVGALPGVSGVPLTGYLLERTDDWELSMFLPAIVLYFSGAAVFVKYGSAEKQPWG